MRWAGDLARMEEGRNAFKILMGSPTGKIPIGRPRRRWKDNIRMDLEDIFRINLPLFSTVVPSNICMFLS